MGCIIGVIGTVAVWFKWQRVPVELPAATIARGGDRGFGKPSATGYRDQLMRALEDVDMHLCFELARRRVLPELGLLIAETQGWDSTALGVTE